ncbi:UNVERIFIED_CONTAM: hypothetical protein PYX00_001648 [Menopon gallinae]|uniref:Transmembrane protein 70 n=1 Tax=Menopon gallinae TaxID=328185 RepID=A0AAW2IFR0_9NEOP
MLSVPCLMRRSFSVLNQISHLSPTVPKTGVHDLLSKVRTNNCLYQSRVYLITYEDAVEKNKKQKVRKKLIYYGTLGSKIKGLKALSFSTSFIGLVAQPFLYSQLVKLPGPLMYLLYTAFGIFTFLTPILIHMVARKYVMEITYDPTRDMYEAQTMTFFFKYRPLEFSLSHISKVDSPSIFNSYFIKEEPFIIFQDGFLDNEHYIKIHRYDQPLDLRLNEEGDDKVNNQSKSD